jgi:hypothetical protein
MDGDHDISKFVGVESYSQTSLAIVNTERGYNVDAD